MTEHAEMQHVETDVLIRLTAEIMKLRGVILDEHKLGTEHAECCGRRECAVCYTPWPCNAARAAGIEDGDE